MGAIIGTLPKYSINIILLFSMSPVSSIPKWYIDMIKKIASATVGDMNQATR
jgi:hypothetical protein